MKIYEREKMLREEGSEQDKLSMLEQPDFLNTMYEKYHLQPGRVVCRSGQAHKIE